MSLNRRNIFLTAFILCVFLISGCFLIQTKKDNFNNIILIVVDALRADHLSCYGYHRNTTPFIDSLAKEAMVCYNAYSQSNWTCPSMASIFTGTYPNVHKVYNSPEGITDRFSVLPQILTTIPEALIQKDFYTAAVTSCGWVSENSNYDQGFDEFHLVKRKDEIIIDQAIDFIRENKKEKFFLYVHLLELHDYSWIKIKHKKFLKDSYNLPQDFQDLYQKTPKEAYQRLASIRKKGDLQDDTLDFLIDLYDSYIFYTDRLIGRLVESLQDEKIFKNTVVLIMADHGERFFEHNELLHGGQLLYNEVVHIPLIIHSSLLFPQEEVNPNLVESIDVFPTILDILGMDRIKIGNMDQCQGKSILKGYKNKTALIENSAKDQQKIIHRNWSYIYHTRDNNRELYDLSVDPLERNNLADTQKIVVKKMHNLLIQKINDSLALSQNVHPEDEKIDKQVLELLRSLGYIK